MTRKLLSLAVLTVLLVPMAVLGQSKSPVADAAKDRNFAGVATLIQQGADVNARQSDGTSALHWAAHWDNMEAADLLLKAGANPMASTRLGATPMFVATNGGSSAMVARLLAAGVDPNVPFLSNGETALMVAARSGNIETVKLLLDAKADIDARENLRETTALIWAAEEGHTDIVSLLLSRGANPAAASKIVIAANNNRDDDDAAAAAPASTAPAAAPAMSANGKGGVTALMVATRERAVDTIKALLDAGAPIDQRSGNGTTALVVALQNGDAATARLLIERGADVNIPNLKGWTPLYLAVKARTREIGTVPNPVIDVPALMDVIKLMVEKGANVNAQTDANSEVYGATTWFEDAGATALVRAAYCGDLEVIKYLLAHGADPHLTTKDLTTSLMALAGVGYGDGFTENIGTPDDTFEALKLLVDAGVPINAANSSGVTALHGATHKNFVRGIQYLVDHGADMTAVSMYKAPDGFLRNDTRGQSLMDWATGVMVNGQSSSYKTEAVALVTKLLKERGLFVEGLTFTRGGVNLKPTY